MKKRGEDWRKTRKRHLKTFPECRACESDRNVLVHHVRYVGTVGQNERSGDLVTLCRYCHDALHRELGRTPGPEPQFAWLTARRLER